MKQKQNKIRNFCIISHINHGKSTLADRFLEITKSVGLKKIERIMDDMVLEQERGITIKLNTAQMQYQYQEEDYLLNLIDTPGHIDFTYEVSHSLTACQGVILLIDASKGIQAQTITNLKLAKNANLVVIPVINKIDLKNTEIDKIKTNIAKLLDIAEAEISLISAKENIGIEELMARIIKEIPAPDGKSDAPLQGLIFDAYYDKYQGVTGLIYIKNGTIKVKEQIKLMRNEKKYQISNLFIKTPEMQKISCLKAGEVGLFQANIKKLEEIIVGETVTHFNNPSPINLPTYKPINHVVFANIFANLQENYQDLVQALAKIKLNDNSFYYQKSFSETFGNGFHCRFLGLLHLEIIQARIEKEYQLEVIVTYPTVKYQLFPANQKSFFIENLNKVTNWNEIRQIAEPIVDMQVLTPLLYLGLVADLIKKKRGQLLNKKIFDQEQILLETTMPMAEIVIDFFDQLKSLTNGYASFDYQFKDYQIAKLKKLDVHINKKIVPAFSRIVHQEQVYIVGKEIVVKLKETIPKHNFEISLQVVVGNQIVVRDNIRALKKNVTAKCYGGDISRKKKLWKKQKLGKKKMKLFGKVNIPSKTFLKVLKTKI